MNGRYWREMFLQYSTALTRSIQIEGSRNKTMRSRFPLSARRLARQKGAVTISYLSPYTTAPTVNQMLGTPNSTVVATVVASAAADTSAVITHDFGLANSEITQGFPTVVISPLADPEITSGWWEASQNPNYTVLQKNTTAAGVLTKVTITRPSTLVR